MCILSPSFCFIHPLVKVSMNLSPHFSALYHHSISFFLTVFLCFSLSSENLHILSRALFVFLLSPFPLCYKCGMWGSGSGEVPPIQTGLVLCGCLNVCKGMWDFSLFFTWYNYNYVFFFFQEKLETYFG